MTEVISKMPLATVIAVIVKILAPELAPAADVTSNIKVAMTS